MRLKALWGAVPLAVLAAIIAVAVPGGAASTWDPAGTSSSPHSLTNLDDIVVESSDGDVWFVGGHQNQINKLIADDIDVLNHLGSDRLVVNNYIMEYVSSDSDLNHILNEINALKPQVDVDIISEASLTGSTQNAFFNNITRSNTPSRLNR